MTQKRWLVLAIILFAALLFRVVGLQFGKPLVVHPDEHELLIHAMEAGARSGNPGWFEYPSAMVYWTLLVQGVRYVLTGAENPAEYWGEFKTNPFPYHLWVRFTVALMGVLGVYAIWLLGREWDRGRQRMRFIGWGSAALLAVHFLHLRDSHFATVDIPLATAITFALWLLLREFHRERTNVRRMLLIAFYVGMCCGVKYTAAPLIFPLLYVALENVFRDEKVSVGLPWLIGSGAILLVAAGLGFFATTPYALLDSNQFWKDLGYQWFTSKAHTPIYGGGETILLGYLQGPWMWGGGTALGVLGFFGFMMAVLRLEPEDKVILLFAVPYYLFISILSRVWGRWFLPIAILEILWAVRFIAVYCHHPWLEATVGLKGRKAIAVGSVLLIASTSALPAMRLLLLLRTPDTRAVAAEALGEVLTEDDFVLVTAPPYFCPPIPDPIPRKNEDGLLRDRGSHENGSPYALEMLELEDIDDEGITHVLYSSFYWDAAFQDFMEEAYPGSATYRQFVEDLQREGREVYEVESTMTDLPFHPENIYAPTFNLWRWKQPGPTVRLYGLHSGRGRS
jgi:hypothetical protein